MVRKLNKTTSTIYQVDLQPFVENVLISTSAISKLLTLSNEPYFKSLVLQYSFKAYNIINYGSINFKAARFWDLLI